MKICHCKDCPAAFTEGGMYGVDMGCLPSLATMRKWHEDTGKLWACHSVPNQVCGGFLKDLIKRKATVDFSKSLITEDTEMDEIYDNTIKNIH